MLDRHDFCPYCKLVNVADPHTPHFFQSAATSSSVASRVSPD